ncbi:hypothetical protein SCHPADRAFT_994261 [Schizopora paradoxa]|uniref:Uncharacterized protein n=1 Tax=Schizopora paradoxa TaxID=27342 RepID=A0A0H2SKI4_9AGAM|nr:hypothetical protein SCHPADRAFT_994261 [Schizopora paradoxa]
MTALSSTLAANDLTASTRAVDILDIAFWIYSSIERNRDKASFSAIRRNVYYPLLTHRVRNVTITRPEHLPSFALLLQNNIDASRSCISLKIPDYPLSNQLFDVERAFAIYCTSLTLRALCNLKHFSGELSGWFPTMDVMRETELSNMEFRGRANEEKHENSLDSIDRGCDQLANHLHKCLSDSNLTGNLDDFKYLGPVQNELQSSDASLIEMHLKFSVDVWKALCNGCFPALRRLELTAPVINPFEGLIYQLETSLREKPIAVNGFVQLEMLKLTIHNSQSHTRILSVYCPRLKSLEVEGTGRGGELNEYFGVSMSSIETFIQCHLTLETISLAGHFVNASIKGPQNIVALQHRLPAVHGAVAHIFPNLLDSIHLPSVRHVRIVLYHDFLFFEELQEREKHNIQHIRCLELGFKFFEGVAVMIKSNLNGPSDSDDSGNSSTSVSPKPTLLTSKIAQAMSVFNKLLELGVLLNIRVPDDLPSGVHLISQILYACCDCESLLAVRYKNIAENPHLDDPVNSFNIPVAPPNLRYISLSGKTDMDARLYEVKQQAGGGRVAVRIPLRRQLPVEGRWTVDFTDETIFDHLTGDYSQSQM